MSRLGKFLGSISNESKSYNNGTAFVTSLELFELDKDLVVTYPPYNVNIELKKGMLISNIIYGHSVSIYGKDHKVVAKVLGTNYFINDSKETLGDYLKSSKLHKYNKPLHSIGDDISSHNGGFLDTGYYLEQISKKNTRNFFYLGKDQNRALKWITDNGPESSIEYDSWNLLLLDRVDNLKRVSEINYLPIKVELTNATIFAVNSVNAEINDYIDSPSSDYKIVNGKLEIIVTLDSSTNHSVSSNKISEALGSLIDNGDYNTKVKWLENFELVDNYPHSVIKLTCDKLYLTKKLVPKMFWSSGKIIKNLPIINL